MKLLQQLIAELGGDALKSFTVVPFFGGYFRSVKSVLDYSPDAVVISLKNSTVRVEGEKLEIGNYFEGDLFLKGDIKAVKIEKSD